MIVRGDCINKMANIETGTVDMVLTDLPYGTTACAWDTVIPFDPMWSEVRRVLKTNGAAVFTASQPFTSALVMSNPRDFRYSLVWEKTTATGHLNASKMPMRAHEDIVVFYRKPPTYNPQMTHGHARKVARNVNRATKLSDCYGDQSGITSYDSTSRYPRSVIATSTDKQVSALHPTQKPVALMEYLIRTYTDEGETVLDFTMGSGTTGIACANTVRNFIGIERDEAYFRMAEARIADAVRIKQEQLL